MENKDAKSIFERLQAGKATEEEQKLVKEWLLFGQLPASGVSREELLLDIALMDKQVRLPVVTRGRFRLWPRIAGIAAAVALIVFGVWFYTSHHFNNRKDLPNYTSDIAPGKQGATLTLANGKKIRLTEQAQGKLAEEAGVQISKTASGQLTYEIKGGDAESNKINTLSTAKGETYIVTLPDKSKVWLNAASSLTYSASLNERGLRRVRLEGEAYFEVTKNKKRPFVVESRNQVVTVLGTHFNINSYRNEPAVKTTLLEGSVRVNPVTGYGNIMRHVEQVLKPGQQSLLDGKHVIEVAEADTDEALAWKDGFFRFNGEDVRSIMRKLSRWYDIEVVYEGNVSAEVYYGKVSRSKNISAVLKVLEKSQGVHFKIEGRRVTVLE